MVPGDLKWKHFAPTIILWCLRWYGSTPLSYANISDMLAERGISVHRTTIYAIMNPRFAMRERSAFINRLFNVETILV